VNKQIGVRDFNILGKNLHPTHRSHGLHLKLKISNTADNADITQSQARDTRYRRMQEVNSLCTESGPFRVEYCIVAFHTIQPSSIPLIFGVMTSDDGFDDDAQRLWLIYLTTLLTRELNLVTFS